MTLDASHAMGRGLHDGLAPLGRGATAALPLLGGRRRLHKGWGRGAVRRVTSARAMPLP